MSPESRRHCTRRRFCAIHPSREESVCVAGMSLVALREKAFAMAASLKEKLAPLEGPLAKLQEKLYDVYETVLPYGVTAFYYSFIPIVVLIGYRNAKTLEPKLRFWDLLSPM